MSKQQNPNVVQRWPAADKLMLQQIAKHIVRSETETLRLLTQGAYKALEETEQKKSSNQQDRSAA